MNIMEGSLQDHKNSLCDVTSVYLSPISVCLSSITSYLLSVYLAMIT